MDKTPLKTIKTGNQILVRQCSDEILALRKSGYSRTKVCEVISEIFFLDQNILTPNRLASNLSTVLAGDSVNETASREARINTLRGNIEQILQNLRTKSSLHNKEALAIPTVSVNTTPKIESRAVPHSASTPKPAQSQVLINASEEARKIWEDLLGMMIARNKSYEEKNISKIISTIESDIETYKKLNWLQLYNHKFLATLIHP